MDLEAKAYFRAGCASYKLKLSEQAKSFFDSQLELEPNDSAGTQELNQVKLRLREEDGDTYDFAAIQ